MISYLIGQVKKLGEKSLTLLVGGVGYEVFVSKKILSNIKPEQNLELDIVTIVKEDAFDLYGFTNQNQYYFFKLLVGISGIGPKSALAILDAAEPEDIRQAIINDDPGLLQKVNGIGKKTAERIVVELKSKIGTGLTATTDSQSSSEVMEALESLGYKVVEIREAIKQVDNKLSTEKKISQVLKILGKQ